MLNFSPDDLEKILTLGKPAKNMKGFGFTHGASTSKTTFVPLKNPSQSKMTSNTYQTSGQHISPQRYQNWEGYQNQK